jgi:hypothetical protein
VAADGSPEGAKEHGAKHQRKTGFDEKFLSLDEGL